MVTKVKVVDSDGNVKEERERRRDEELGMVIEIADEAG